MSDSETMEVDEDKNTETSKKNPENLAPHVRLESLSKSVEEKLNASTTVVLDSEDNESEMESNAGKKTTKSNKSKDVDNTDDEESVENKKHAGKKTTKSNESKDVDNTDDEESVENKKNSEDFDGTGSRAVRACRKLADSSRNDKGSDTSTSSKKKGEDSKKSAGGKKQQQKSSKEDGDAVVSKPGIKLILKRSKKNNSEDSDGDAEDEFVSKSASSKKSGSKQSKEINKSKVEVDLDDIECTACHKNINTEKPGQAWRHPVLKVLICKKCYEWYTSDEIEQDEEGTDLQCRWCGDGGKVLLCDYCSNVFCRDCIRLNLGRKELAVIEAADDDEKWHCYVCNPKPLTQLVDRCNQELEAIKIGRTDAKDPSSSDSDSSASEIASGIHDILAEEAVAESVLENLIPLTKSLHDALLASRAKLKKLKLKKSSAEVKNQRKEIVMKNKKQFNKILKTLGKLKKESHSDKSRNKSEKNRKRSSSPGIEVLDLSDADGNGDEPKSGVANGDKDSEEEGDDEPAKEEEEDSENEAATCSKKVSKTKSVDSHKKGKTSHADLEAQRILHRDFLEENDSGDENSDDDDDDSSPEEEEPDEKADSSGDEYNPKRDLRESKLDSRKERREAARRNKMRAAKKSLQKIRENIQKKKEKSAEKEKRSKNKRGKKGEDDSSSDEDEKKKKKKGKKKDEDSSSDDEDDKKKKNKDKKKGKKKNDDDSSSEDDKKKKKKDKKKGKKKDDDDSSSDDEDDKKKKKNLKKKNRDKDSSSEEDDKKKKHKKKRDDDSDDDEEDEGNKKNKKKSKKNDSSDEDSEEDKKGKKKGKKKETEAEKKKNSIKRESMMKKDDYDDSEDEEERGRNKSKRLTSKNLKSKKHEKKEKSKEEEEEENKSGNEKEIEKEIEAVLGDGLLGEVLAKAVGDEVEEGEKKTETEGGAVENEEGEGDGKKKEEGNDEDGDEDEGEKSGLRKKNKDDSKKAKKSDDSDLSSGHDSDLDKDIERLEKSLVKKKKSTKTAVEEDVEETVVEKVGNKKGKKTVGAEEDGDDDDEDSKLKTSVKKVRRNLVDEMFSGLQDGDADKEALDEDDAEADNDNADELDESEDAAKKIDDMDLEGLKFMAFDSHNDAARLELLAEADDDDAKEEEEENEVEEEVEEDDSVEKVVKKSKKKKKDSDSDVVALDSDSDFDTKAKKSKKKKKDKLLDAVLSSSDEEDKKKKKKKDEDDSDAEEEEEDDDDDDDEPKKEKKKGKQSSSSKDEDESSDDSSDVKTKKKKGKKGGKKRKHSDSDSEEEVSDDESDDDGKKKKKGKKDKKKKRRRIKVNSSDEEAADGSENGEEEEGGSSDDFQSPSQGKKRKKIRKILNTKKLSKETLDAAKAEEERRRRIDERQKLFNQVTVEDVNSPTKCPMTTKLVLEIDEETKEPLIEVHKKVICKLKPHQVEAVKFMWNCCCESLEMMKKEEGSGCILAHCMGLGKTLSVISFVHTVLRFKKLTKLKTCLVLCPLNTILNWESEFERWLKGAGPVDVYELSTVKDNWGRSEVVKDWKEGGGVLIMGYEMFRSLSQLTRIKNKKQKTIFTEGFLNPGPDLVVCDEGHILKNDATGLSKACTQIKTRRRIVLTGTPLQNNLIEYHCMVSFVKPGLLGTRKEYLNRFVNPITNGQCSDSTPRDVKVMKNRAHVLHETLAGCVQRKDYSALTQYLLPKLEYVILIRLTKVQIDLYEKYLKRTEGNDLMGPVKGSRIFTDYQNLMKIWTHPWVLKLDEMRQERRRAMKDTDSFLDDESDEDDSFIASDNSGDENSVKGSGSKDDWKPKRKTRGAAKKEKEDTVPSKAGTSKDKASSKSGDSKKSSDADEKEQEEVVKGWRTRSRRGRGVVDDDPIEAEPEVEEPTVISTEWWAEYLKPDDEYNLEISGKLLLLAEILKMSESIGDKVLLFSQSLLSLDLIEKFLAHWDKLVLDDPEKQIAGIQGWDKGVDYIRMDGSTSAQNRQGWTKMFNDEENTKVRLFLISTKAGSLGINLVAANRVIIFDASWNPTHDVQSIFRVYRFGQTKPVYVYRFLAQGTMEEKIYERQVTKQSLAQRVIDEHQIERHFTAADLRELYTFKPDRLDDPERPDKPTPKLPQDRMLAELLTEHKDWIVQYHEHDSLLENKVEEELTEEERKAAWEEYEQDKKGLLKPPPQVFNNMMNMNMMMQNQKLQATQYIPDAHRIAQALYAANPGISQEDLQQRVQLYLQYQMSQQHRAMMLQQQQREMEKLRRMQQETLMRQRQQQMLAYQQMQQMGDGASASSLIEMLAGGAGSYIGGASATAPVASASNKPGPSSAKPASNSTKKK